ncbi:MAG: DoxX family protein [Acidobacteriota bacterium]
MSAPRSKALNISLWIAQIAVAVLYLQTLFFKFTAAPEAVWIFTQLGVEPWGRVATGAAELIVALLLLVPMTAAIGAVMSLGVIAGAIVSHLAVLGIVVQNDGGTLFIMALVIFFASTFIAWIRRDELPIIGARFAVQPARG